MGESVTDRFLILWSLAAGMRLRRRNGAWCFEPGSATADSDLVAALDSDGEVTLEAGSCELTEKGRARFTKTVRAAQAEWPLGVPRSFPKRG